MKKLLPKLTYANVMATIAVFLALGGISYAAIKLPNNSVGSKQLKGGAVKRSDLAKNAVNSAKVAKGSLLSEDFAAGQLPAGPQGSAGEAATKLFASITDPGATEAYVTYGRGVTGVVDPNPGNTYTVTFAQSVKNCVVQAGAGFGNPLSPGAIGSPGATPWVYMSSSVDQQVNVSFHRPLESLDTSFMIAAFC